MTTLIGIDLGTSSVKTALIDTDTLTVLADASQEYSVTHPKLGYAEQDPDDWWQAVVNTVREVVEQFPEREIVGIGLDGQMHGTVCMNKKGEWVHPAIIWADTRTVSQVQRLTETIQADPDAFRHVSGLPAAGFMAVSLMWLAEHNPDVLKQTHKVLLPKDVIRYKLTGTIGTDVSDASATWLMDVQDGTWSSTLLALCGVEPDLMPTIDASQTVVGEVTATAAEALGIASGIPVIAGSADLPAQAIGHGLIKEGTGMITVGTGGQVFVPMSSPTIDPQHRYYTFAHNVPDQWYAQAAILSAGLSLRWLRDTLDMTDMPNAYVYLSSLADEVGIGADNLLFLPYLAGERTPHMNPLASAMFFGLRLQHERGHLARAVMEGVAFALKSCVDLIATDLEMMVLSGGVTDSDVWRQILADVLNVPLLISEPVPYGSIGSAILAGVGTGVYSSFEEAIDLLPDHDNVIEPTAKNVNRYQAYYEQYQQLYPKVKENMEALSLLE